MTNLLDFVVINLTVNIACITESYALSHINKIFGVIIWWHNIH